MASNFEELVFSIIATDKGASAAFDRFRQKVDQTSRSVDESSGKLDENAKAVERAGKEAAKATPLVSALAGVGNSIPGGGMGALIGAGIALSPVLVTIGTGLVGFGAAAVGAVAPVLKAAQATGGLQKNMAKLDPEQQQLARSVLALGKQYDVFQKSLQPEVLGVFGQGVQLAGHLMRDLQPIAKNTGVALGQLLGRIDAEFASKQWQSFFTWMASNVGPDIKLVGTAFVNLQATLPPLLRLLNPVAVDFLAIVDAGTKLVQKASEVGNASTKTGQHMSSLEQITTALRLALFAPGVGLYHALKLIGVIGPDTGKGIQATGAAAAGAAYHVGTLAQAVTALNTAESKSLNTQLAYSNALIAAGNDAKALRQALHASSGEVGLHTAAQRASFAAANTYISDLEQAALQAWASGRGATGAARAIQNGLPILEQAARHNRLLWQEVQTLKGWLDKLRLEPAIQEKINVLGIGKWSATAATHAIAQGPGPFAAGGQVRGGVPGRDSVPILAMPGEVVVPTSLVRAGAVDHLRGQLPGFAAGGIVPSYRGSAGGLKPWATRDMNVAAGQILAGIGNAMVSAFRSALSAFGGGFADTGARSGSAALAQSFAASVLPRGWSFPALLSLWNQESGWNAYAVNPSSGAYGIPQSLGHGHPYNLGDYKAQIMWGINYIAGRYGSSQNAWGHEQAFNWYDRGGWLPPGLSMAYNGTGRPERVGGGDVIINAYITLPPGADREQGRRIADALKSHIRAGGSLYPAGVTPR